MIPESAVLDIVRQVGAQSIHGQPSTVRAWMLFATALREAFALATCVWDGPAPVVLLCFAGSHVRMKIRVPKRPPKRPAGPGVVVPFATNPGFGRSRRAVSR